MAGVSPCLLGTIELSMALAWYRAVDVCGFSHVAASLVVLPCQLVRMHMRTRWVAESCATHGPSLPTTCICCRGECMTINTTFVYTIDTSGSGQVETCTVTWGSVHGLGLQGAERWGRIRVQGSIKFNTRCWIGSGEWLPNAVPKCQVWMRRQRAYDVTCRLPPSRRPVPRTATPACTCASHASFRPAAPAPEVTDALDIWVEATGMLHEAECDADEEIRAALAEDEEGGWEGGSGWDGGASGGSGSGAPGGPVELARGASWLPLWRM